MINQLVIFLISGCLVNAQSYCNGRARMVNITLQHKGSLCKSINDSYSECSSLDEAFQQVKNLNDYCFFVDKKFTDERENMANNVTLENVAGFTLMGKSSETFILCASKTFTNGIYILNSSNIVLTLFQLYGCSLPQIAKTFKIDNKFPRIASALYADHVENLLIEDVKFVKSIGYGMVIYNPVKSNVFNKVSLEYSRSLDNQFIVGGVYVDFIGNDSSYSSISFNNNSKFVQNPFEGDVSCESLQSIRNDALQLTPFNKGRAISLFFRNGTKNKIIKFGSMTMFINNKAMFGGAVYIHIEEEVSNVSVYFHENGFVGNKASVSGGAIYIESNASSVTNTITFFKNKMSQNSACVGGVAMIVHRNSGDKNFFGKIVFNSTEFSQNYAVLGSAIQTEQSNVYLINVNITYNNIQEELGSGQGVLYSTNSNLSFYGVNRLVSNNNTAIVLDFSLLKVYGKLILDGNLGSQGGAVAMYGQSLFFLKRHGVAHFTNNKASKQGGAIYVLVPGPTLRPWITTPYKIYDCFIKRDSNFKGEVLFSGNSASTQSGNDIFTSTLQTCKTFNNENVSYVISNWTNFHFTHHTNSITTNAVRIEPFPEDWNVQPGRHFNAKVHLHDERNQLVNEEVSIFVRDTSIAHTDHRRYVIQNERVMVRLYGIPEKKFSVSIQSVSSLRTFSVQMSNCTFRYKYDVKNQMCSCNNYSYCTADVIYLPVNKWAHKDKLYSCPVGYCKNCSKDDLFIRNRCKFDEKKQCSENRNQLSILCSKCNDNYSVVFGSFECHYCVGKSKVPQIVIIVLLVIVLLNLLLLLINMSSFSWYLIPTIYSYQILDEILPEDIDPVATVIVELVNSFGMNVNQTMFHFCFFDGMTDLDKKIFLFVLPFCWIVVLLLVYNIGKCITNKFNRNTFSRAFVIISHVIYTNFLKVIFLILMPIKIDTEIRIFAYAEQIYFTGKTHIILCILCCIVLLVVIILFPLVVLASTVYWSRHGNENNKDWVCCYDFKSLRLKRIFEFYREAEINSCMTTVFYFIARILVLSFYNLAPIEIRKTCVSVACLCVATLFLLFKPYYQRLHLNFHAIQLINLLVIAVLNASLQWLFDPKLENRFRVFQIVLTYVPLCLCLILFIKWLWDRFGGRVPHPRFYEAVNEEEFPQRLGL